MRGGVLLASWVLLGAVAVVPLSLLHLWRPVVVLPVLLVALAVAVRVAGGVPAPTPPRRGAVAAGPGGPRPGGRGRVAPPPHRPLRPAARRHPPFPPPPPPPPPP